MERQNGNKSLKRAVELLLYMAASPGPLSFTQIAKATGMGKATANRFLTTLEELGMIHRHPDTGKYRLGLAALRIGIAAGNQLELRHELRPFLAELTRRTGETSNLVVWESTHPVFIDNVESPQNLRMYSRVGRQTHPYCTSVGKVFLAYRDRAFLDSIFEAVPFEARTPKSITSKEKFLQELESVRQQGYATDDEEAEVGARCVGAPIFDSTGQVIATISISGPSSRISQDQFPELGQLVREVAIKAQTNLGFSGVRSPITVITQPVHQLNAEKGTMDEARVER